MAALIDASAVKRKMYFEFENAPSYCLDVEVSTPTARGGQTLVRLKMRNLLTRAVFDKTFKAGDKFKELQDKEPKELIEDAKEVARQKPGQTILISAAVGLVLGLVLRGGRK